MSGFLALLASAVLYASFSIWVRLLGRELSPAEQIAFRNSIALALAVVAVQLSKQSFGSLRKANPWLIVGYTLAFPIAVVLFTYSVLQTKIMTTLFWLYLSSLVTSLVVGVGYFKEKMTGQKILSLGLVVVGLAVYNYPFSGQFLSVGAGLAVLSGVFDATANGFKKFFSGKVDRFVLVALQMVGGLVVAGILSLQQGFTFPSLSPTAWIVGVVFGFSLVLVSYLTLFGFSHFDLNLGTVVLASELFFASVLGWLIFQESVSLAEGIGGGLIFLATVVAQTTLFPLEKQWRQLTHLWRSRLASD